MAGGLLKAVRDFLPEARQVLDRFHVVKLFNEKLTKLCRDLYREATDDLHKHRQSLLAWYDDSISTGPLEGVNNKLKLLQRQAFGYRDLELFKLRILLLHTTRRINTAPTYRMSRLYLIVFFAVCAVCPCHETIKLFFSSV